MGFISGILRRLLGGWSIYNNGYASDRAKNLDYFVIPVLEIPNS